MGQAFKFSSVFDVVFPERGTAGEQNTEYRFADDADMKRFDHLRCLSESLNLGDCAD